jgi:3-dehydroquinate dehydratase
MRKTRKRKGGSESILMYAQKMKNKEPIDVVKFKACLDQTSDPLKILYTIDEKQYTINEWALICEVDSSIYDVFCNYEYDLTRRIEYPFHFLYNIKYKNSLLEAYLLKSNHLNSISTMIKQIQSSSSADIINNNMFYHWYSESVVPTIIKCMFDMITISKSNIYIALSTPILAFYTDLNMLNRLTNNKNDLTMIKLFYYAITSNSIGLLQLISTQLTPTLTIEFVLNPDIVEALLIQDNQELYLNVIMLLNGADVNVIGAFICKILGKECTNESVTKVLELCNTTSYKKFFEVIGNYAIQKLMIPDIQKNPHIIVICHGTSMGHEEYKFNFRMRQLCFYADKGCVLIDNNPFSKPMEELICSGYYDATLKCQPATDGTIMTENIVFSFEPNNFVQNINNYLGFYVCNNGQVTKINTKIDRSAKYRIDYIMELSAQIADMLLGNAADVDLMIYSCIGYSNTTKSTTTIPKYNK